MKLRLLLLVLLFTSAAKSGDLRKLKFLFRPDFSKKSIQASVLQTWQFAQADTFSLFLGEGLKLDSVNHPMGFTWKQTGRKIACSVNSAGRYNIQLHYSGKPAAAKNPPWDGGLVWRKDPAGEDWLGVSCQGQGAHIWWPAPPDHLQEADTVEFTAVYPSNLFFKGNGRMTNDWKTSSIRTTTWQTTYPINLYNITVNIADYAHYKERLERADGSALEISYYPLRVNLDKAKKQFQQTIPMLKCFENAFGNYPCSNDGFSVVETAYAGMEHQGAIAYGNGYKDGYGGADYSGVGILFDFILIHESGHEWWGNSVTAMNPEDFWMQEAFCTYSEMVYVNCVFGPQAALKYINAKKRLVDNVHPILGKKDSGIDIYTKGALMVHTLSAFASTNEQWEKVLKDFAVSMKFQKVSTEMLANWFSANLEGVSPVFFYQYLTLAKPPILEHYVRKTESGFVVKYRINNALQGFEMPIFWNSSEPPKRTICNGSWQEFTVSGLEEPSPDSTQTYFLTAP
jgi:aminopeptidase N